MQDDLDLPNFLSDSQGSVILSGKLESPPQDCSCHNEF